MPRPVTPKVLREYVVQVSRLERQIEVDDQFSRARRKRLLELVRPLLLELRRLELK